MSGRAAEEPDQLMVQQCTGKSGFGYEYMGLNGRW